MAYAYQFKLILIGDSGVGKSCLLMQFVENDFQPLHELTIGVEFGISIVEVNSVPVKLHIWDTAGQESFRSITRSYYRGAAGVLLVYDVTSRASFEHLSVWLDDARQHVSSSCVITLVANKVDAPLHSHEVERVEGVEFAHEHSLLFIEVSAKNGDNVEEAFLKTSAAIHQRVKSGIVDLTSEVNGIKLSEGFLMQTKKKKDGGKDCLCA